MDQHLFELALLRAIERLVGVLLGGLAIYLGYRLFMNIPQATESSAEADFSGKLKIILTRIGPGVFFALFGAGIIWASYHYQVTAGPYIGNPVVKADSLKPDTQDSTRLVYYNGMSEGAVVNKEVIESQRAEVRRALRVLNKWLVGKSLAEQAALEPILTTSRLALIQSVWQSNWGGHEEFRNWIKDGALNNNRQTAFDEPYALYQLND